jgi:hypothetical protein
VQRSSRAFATAAVVAGLGGLAAIALGSQPDRRGTAAKTALTPLRVVRTQTEVHTITRVRRDLPPIQPRTVRPTAPPRPVVVTPVAAPAPAASAPVQATPVVQRTPAPAPLRTRTSGGTGTRRGDDGSEGSRRKEQRGDGQDD